MRKALATAAVVAVLISGCGKKKKPPVAVAQPVGAAETGIASWYGHPYHGRRAANGEVYDMEQMTAAHRTLPFGTWVRVLNLTNQKTADVRITDRGPFIDQRIIDLSHAAARAIEMIGPGTARVRVVIIQPPKQAEPALFAVQTGAFRDRNNAERMREEMERKYGSARLVLRQGNPEVWRVLVGTEPTEERAAGLVERLRADGAKRSDAFVVRLDF